MTEKEQAIERPRIRTIDIQIREILASGMALSSSQIGSRCKPRVEASKITRIALTMSDLDGGPSGPGWRWWIGAG